MRVFVAGGTGAIGRPVIERLRERGHHITTTTRSTERAARLYKKGIEAISLDVFDRTAVIAAVKKAKPDVVIHQLTSLPQVLDRHARHAFLETGRIRRETMPTFVAAAQEAGAKRLIVQSTTFVTGPDAPEPTTEATPIWSEGPPDIVEMGTTAAGMEKVTLEASGLESVVLRYGFLYGAGTWYEPEGAIGKMIMKRRYPLIGDGNGRQSFVHVDDAADATVLALDRGPTGIYNICDDEPVDQNTWLPTIASELGAPAPWRVPAWLARWMVGPLMVHYATTLRGASNARARRELAWRPRPWRTGFHDVFSTS